MVWCDLVDDTWGTPNIWITEDLDQDPDDMAPASIRVVWKAVRSNCGSVRVTAISVDRIQDAAKSGRSHAIPDSVPEEHLEELKGQMHLRLAQEFERDQEVNFRGFDEVLNVNITDEGDQR